MRKLLKITATFALAFVFTTGMAFAQNDADLSQTGDNNNANVEQAGGSTADLTQDGDLNQIDLAQEGYFSGQSTQIDQIGNRNEADVTSSSGNGLQGNGNDLDILQEGNLNTFSTPTMQGYVNDYDVSQVGNRNYAEIETRFGAGGQTGESDIEITQNGNRNSGIITATEGGNNHEFRIKQKFGDRNTASISFTPSDAVDGAVGKAFQYGSDNSATIDFQSATSDRAVVVQNGNSNSATVLNK